MKMQAIQLAERLKALPGRMETMAAEAVTASARRASTEAQAFVPVDSGELRASISAQSAGRLTTVVLASADHAAMVEYGTSRMAAQPYMLPAAQREQAAFFQDAGMQFRQLAKEI